MATAAHRSSSPRGWIRVAWLVALAIALDVWAVWIAHHVELRRCPSRTSRDALTWLMIVPATGAAAIVAVRAASADHLHRTGLRVLAGAAVVAGAVALVVCYRAIGNAPRTLPCFD